MKKTVLFAFCCFVFHGVTAQSSNTISTLILPTPSQSNLDVFPQLNVSETSNPNKDKFTCVLNLLKSALSDQLQNSQCQTLEETTRESVLSSLNSLIEEEQIKKDEEQLETQDLTNSNECDAENALYRKIITKIASAFTKQKNNTKNHGNLEMENMIPISKPRAVLPRIGLNQNVMADYKPSLVPRTNPNPRAVSFVPEKIVQTNMNLIPNGPLFNIPCQRAADVLDMTNVAIPEEVCKSVDLNLPNVNPIVQIPTPNLPKQAPEPVTLSVNCADTDDTVAMLFKPKTISLMQVYGNLLKNITITVLVPYHMSKLAVK